MNLKTLLAGWNRFFFEPVSPVPLGLFRIAFGLLLLAQGLVLAPDYLVWYGDHGVLSRAVAPRIPGGLGYTLMQHLPPGDAGPIAFFAAYMASALLLTLGLFTRVNCILVFLATVSFHHRDALLLNAGDYFMRLSSFFLIFSPAGAAFSADRLIRLARGRERGKPAPREPWAMRLIQIQLALVYWNTFLWKIRGDTWLNGTSLYYTARLPEFWRFPVPYVFEHMWTIKLATWGTLLVEFALAVLIWIREFRYWVMLAGVMLHLGIDYSMNIPFFGLIMMSGYIVFLEEDRLNLFFAWLRQKMNRPLQPALPIPVIYDGKCSFCARSIEVIQALDILRRFQFWNLHAPETKKAFPDLDKNRGLREALVRTPAGEWLGSFYAFRRMAKETPLGWVVYPLLLLPGLDKAGTRYYEKIASKRHRAVNPA